MYESNSLFTSNLDSINRSKLSKIFPKLLFSHILGEIPEIHVTGSTRVLYGKSNRCWHLGRLIPTHLDVLAPDGELLDRIQVKVVGGRAVKKRDESTVLVGQETRTINPTPAHVTKNCFRRGLGW